MLKIDRLSNLEIVLLEKQLDSMIKKNKVKRLLENWMLELIKKYLSDYFNNKNFNELQLNKITMLFSILLKAYKNYKGVKYLNFNIINKLEILQQIIFKNKKLHTINDFYFDKRILITNYKELDYVNFIYNKSPKNLKKNLFLSCFISFFENDKINNYLQISYIKKHYPLLANNKEFHFGLYPYQIKDFNNSTKEMLIQIKKELKMSKGLFDEI